MHDQVPVEGVALRRDPVGGADQTDQLRPVGAVTCAGRGHHVLLQHDRTQIVRTHVQSELADLLAGRQPRALQMRDVVEEEPGQRHQPQVLDGRCLGPAAQVVVLRLVGPRDERPETAGAVLDVTDHPQVLDALGVGLAGAHHERRGRLHAKAVSGLHD